MKYEEYLDSFCRNETMFHFGDVYDLSLPLRIRIKIWLLERKGYRIRISLDWHYYTVDPTKTPMRIKGYGFVRIYKYRPLYPNSNIEIQEGKIEIDND